MCIWPVETRVLGSVDGGGITLGQLKEHKFCASKPSDFVKSCRFPVANRLFYTTVSMYFTWLC